MQLALHISQELNHSLDSKTGPNSFTQIVNGPRISTTNIKKFVTKLRPATFDNKCSRLNKIWHLHQWLQVEADEGREYGANNQVAKFLQLGHEFFRATSETIATLTPQELCVADDRDLQQSACFKPWRFWENLCDVVEDATRKKSSEDEMVYNSLYSYGNIVVLTFLFLQSDTATS